MIRIVVSLSLACAGSLLAAQFHVSPGGKDAASGTLAAPWRTLAGARDALRRLRATGALKERAEVIVHGGTYRLGAPFVLTPLDSGTTYRAAPGEKPVVSGGVPVLNWRLRNDGSWEASLPVVDGKPLVFNQLFRNGTRCTRARTPNEGKYFTVAGKAEPPAQAFRFEPGDIDPWPDLEDIYVVVYHSWETSWHRIESVEGDTVTFTGPARWPFERWGHGQRYYVENAPDALDAPGEWRIERARRTVHYLPRPGESLRESHFVAPRLGSLVELRGEAALGLYVEDVSLMGLSFQHDEWTLEPQGHSDGQAAVTVPAAIMATGARNCRIEGCEVARTGHYGIWFAEGCVGNTIRHCRLFDLGAGGIRIGTAYRPKDEVQTASHNVVDNNHLFDGGHVFAAGVGVWVAQSHHNTVSHNEIHDFRYSGMSIGWNWNDAPNSCHDNVIEYNHVHHVMNGHLNDGGAIYTLGTSPGSVIRQNLLHDIWPYNNIAWGVYLDATTNGYLVEKNIVYHTFSGGLMMHNGGHNDTIRNNVFAFSAKQMLWPCWTEKEPNTFECNIVYLTQGQLFIPMSANRLLQRLGAHESLGVWDRNLYWTPDGGKSLSFYRYSLDEWRQFGLDTHSVVADPEFVAAAQFDFRLKPGSPAFALGFQRIDVDRIGLYGDPEWVAEARAVKHPPIKLPPPPPPPPPREFSEGFEETAVGERPRWAQVSGEQGSASIRVVDDNPYQGKHCLRLRDAAEASPAWQPHMFYRPNLTDGTVRESFAIRVGKDANFRAEWRDSTEYPSCIGPSVVFLGNGNVEASGKFLANIPVDTWVLVTIEAALGGDGTGAFGLTLQVPGHHDYQFPALPWSGNAFRSLNWLGFISEATTATTSYIDELSLKRMPNAK
jgi:hypothetical protein